MKTKIKVEASFSGVLPVGSYSNQRPGFSASVEYDTDLKDSHVLAELLDRHQQELQAICYKNFEREAEKAKILKIKQDLNNFRFYKIGDEEFPSVTSIQNYDKVWEISDDDLRQYAAQGNIIDAEVKNFVKTGVFKPSSELLECTADRHILKKGSLQLSLEPCAIVAFLEKYPIQNLKVCETALFNKQYRYAGLPDLVGEYGGIPTLVSIKRTKNAQENAIQEAAYSKCEGMEHIKQALVIELKNEADGGNKSGYSKPTVITELDKYFELFLYRRNQVKQIYGV